MTTLSHEHLSALVYRLRLARGLTQAGLGSLSGVAPGTVSQIERGVDSRQWRPDTLRALVQALHGVAPIAAPDLVELERHTGLSAQAILPIGGGGGEGGGSGVARALVRQLTRDAALNRDPRQMDRLRQLTDTLVRLVGPGPVVSMLETMLALLKAAPPTAPTAPTAAPAATPASPVPGPLAVVQDHAPSEGISVRTYAPLPSPPAPVPHGVRAVDRRNPHSSGQPPAGMPERRAAPPPPRAAGRSRRAG